MIAPRDVTTRVSWIWEHDGAAWTVHAEVIGDECSDLWIASGDLEMAVSDVGGTADDEERLSHQAVDRARDKERAVSRERAIASARGRE